MKAYASVSGGVIFVPDENEPAMPSVSYRDLLKEEQGDKPAIFGKRTANVATKGDAKHVA